MLSTDQNSGESSDSPSAQAAKPATWSAVTAVGVGAFALVTTEFLPVGLLPDISRELAISDGQAGLMVTVPGIFAAIAAPLTVAAAGRIDRRHVLWGLLSLLIISNILVASAGNLFFLLMGRMLLGIAVGGFWTVGGTLGPRMRPGKEAARATSIILSGISLGSVAGVPAGTLIGQFVGWRIVFAIACVIAVLVTAALVKLLPPLPSNQSTGLSHAFDTLKLRKVQIGLLAVGLNFFGQFSAYTYIAPYLNQVSHVETSLLSAVLLGYGGVGFIGNIFGGWVVERNVRFTFIGTSLLIGMPIVFLLLVGSSQSLAISTILTWGFGFGMLPIVAQTWMLNSAPGRAESVSALLVSTLQAAIGAGALVGGIAVDGAGVMGPLSIGALAALIAAVLIIITARRGNTG